MLKNYLSQLDLDEREIEGYLALLEIGETQIVPLTQKVDMPRTTLAYVLERLREKGLIEILNQGGSRRVYIPKSPQIIKELLLERKGKIENKIDALEQALPQLLQHYQTSSVQPKVRLYQGEGIRKIYEEILTLPIDEYWFVSEPTNQADLLGKRWLADWIKRRVGKGIQSNGLRPQGVGIKGEAVFSESSKKYKRTIRYLPKDFRSPAHIIIYSNSVAIITTAKESFGVVIDSKDYAETMRNWFDALWKQSKEK